MADPIDTEATRRRANAWGTIGVDLAFGLCDEVDRLRADNAALRDLLAKALPWIDPNDSHDDYLLTVAIREALGEGS